MSEFPLKILRRERHGEFLWNLKNIVRIFVLKNS